MSDEESSQDPIEEYPPKKQYPARILCSGTNDDGSLCGNKARKSGFCAKCDPHAAEEEKRKQRSLEAEKKQKEDQAQEIFEQNTLNMIAECQTIEDLRKLELKILEGVVINRIDSRAAGAIVNILKHQEDLIDRKHQGSDELKDNERERAVRKSKEMNTDQMLGLIGDLAHGMRKLIKEAKAEEAVTIDITAKGEYVQIEHRDS